ncbi:MAG TPA: DJ-1/PfpI family protein [Actinomycetota bacterium]|nr:DJ-1/PfpI family protein [Actinomycetota bacterium]
MPLRIGVALFDGAEELDWAGPWEVLSYWAHSAPADGVQVFTVAPSSPVTCAKGLRVIPDYSWADHPPIDVLVYPGGMGTRAQVGDENVRAWIKKIATGAHLVTSVCTGSLVLADAGLLGGRPATSHWASLDRLRDIDPTVDVRDDERFVDDGDVITAAGVSAGIDMALHLVARLGSIECAAQVRRGIQYDPQPPA